MRLVSGWFAAVFVGTMGVCSPALAQSDLTLNVRITEIDVQDPSDSGINADDEPYIVDLTNGVCYTPNTGNQVGLTRSMRGSQTLAIPSTASGYMRTDATGRLSVALWEEGGGRGDEYRCLLELVGALDPSLLPGLGDGDTLLSWFDFEIRGNRAVVNRGVRSEMVVAIQPNDARSAIGEFSVQIEGDGFDYEVSGVAFLERIPPQPSFELVCKGRGGMTLQLNDDSDLVSLQSTGVRIQFDRASTAADTALPPPGTCAWRDRPLNGAEPTVMWFDIRDADVAVTVDTNGRLTSSDRGGYSFRAVGDSPDASDLNYVIANFFGGTTFRVMAYTAPNGVLVVTDVLR